MVIQIDLDMLSETGLTPDEFIFLTLLHKNQQDWIQDQKVALQINAKKLEAQGWAKVNREVPAESIVRYKFSSLTEPDAHSQWVELCAAYPHVVTKRGGGRRTLHALDPDADSNKKAREKYLRRVKSNPFLHSKVMRGLEKELEVRKRGNDMEFMQKLETWVNNSTWEQYLDLVMEDAKIIETGPKYGENLE